MRLTNDYCKHQAVQCLEHPDISQVSKLIQEQQRPTSTKTKMSVRKANDEHPCDFALPLTETMFYGTTSVEQPNEKHEKTEEETKRRKK